MAVAAAHDPKAGGHCARARCGCSSSDLIDICACDCGGETITDIDALSLGWHCDSVEGETCSDGGEVFTSFVTTGHYKQCGP